MKRQEIKAITESTLSIIRHDFKEAIQYYPFSQMVLVTSDEIHFEVYAINKEEIEQLGLKKSRIANDEFSKRLFLVVDNNYRESGPTVYSMEKWKGLERIPEESKHFYDFKYLRLEGNEVVCKMPYFIEGRGYQTCTSVAKANKDMNNPLLENIKSAENLLKSYELFLRGINKEIVLRQYEHGDEGVKQYERERKQSRKHK